MVLTYSLMKEKRTFPSNIITCICVALFMFYFAILFNLGDPNRVRCIDEINVSAPGSNNNTLCQAQSVFVHYGILASVMWYFLLVMNVYAVTFSSLLPSKERSNLL